METAARQAEECRIHRRQAERTAARRKRAVPRLAQVVDREECQGLRERAARLLLAQVAEGPKVAARARVAEG